MDNPALHHKTVLISELPPLFAAIEVAMQNAERITQRAAEEHLWAFTVQMYEKLGTDEIALNEPYLPETLANASLDYLRRLERLMDILEQRVENDRFRTTIFNFHAPLLPQMHTRLQLEETRHRLSTKQELDAVRQPAFGIAKYIWRADGDSCEICAPMDGRIFAWGDNPAPGSAHPNCQCSAEPALEDAGEPKVETAHLDKVAVFAALAAKMLQKATARRKSAERAAREAAKKPEPAAGKPQTPAKPAETPKQPVRPQAAKPTGERPKNVPKNWEKLPSKKQDGVKYVDPKNKGNDIRIQKGNPNSQYPNQKGEYVRWKKDGQWLDKNGRPSNDPEKTHIPIEEFNFDLEIFK